MLFCKFCRLSYINSVENCGRHIYYLYQVEMFLQHIIVLCVLFEGLGFVLRLKKVLKRRCQILPHHTACEELKATLPQFTFPHSAPGALSDVAIVHLTSQRARCFKRRCHFSPHHTASHYLKYLKFYFGAKFGSGVSLVCMLSWSEEILAISIKL